MEQQNYGYGVLNVSLSYTLNKMWKLNFTPQLYFDSGYRQNQAAEEFSANSLSVKNASVDFTPIEYISLSAGLLPQRKNLNKLLIGNRTFPAASLSLQSESATTLQVGATGQAATPTSSNKTTEPNSFEKTPRLDTAGAFFNLNTDIVNAKLVGKYFEFKNLPGSVAKKSSKGGNNVEVLDAEKDLYNFSVALMPAISYSPSLGGVMTPVGSPPNVVFLGYMNQQGPHNLNFANWFIAVFPIAIIILVIMTLLLIYGPYRFSLNVKKIRYKEIEKNFLDAKKLKFDQKLTLIIFAITAILWIGKDLFNAYLFKSVILEDYLTGILGGFLLFVVPTNLKNFNTILNKEDVNYLPWDMVLLFGGGLALSNVMDKTGLLSEAVNLLQTDLGGIGVYGKFVLLLVLVLFLTEVMSNVALCAVIIPIVMSWATRNNLDSLHVGLMTCIVTSFGFSFPMSTPPNALVFATGYVDFKSMLKVGAVLNILAVIIMATIGYYWTQLIM